MSEFAVPAKPYAERECRMRGANVTLLRWSRAFCAAPVHLERRNSTYAVSTSRRRAQYACIVLTLLDVIIFIGLLFGAYKDVKMNRKSERVNKTATAMWCLKYFLTTGIFILSAFDGLGRMRRFIFYHARLQKIRVNMSNESMPNTLDKILGLKLAICVLSAAIVYIMKVLMTLQMIVDLNSVVLFVVFTLLNLGYMIVYVLMELQVTFTINSILFSLKSVNECFERLHSHLEVNGTMADSAAVVETIYRLSKNYAALVDLGKQVNNTEGWTIMLSLCTYTIHLLMNVYYFMTSFYFTAQIWWQAREIAYFGYCLYSILLITTLVEPCHKTQDELNKTKVLISQLLSSPDSARHPISVALSKFYQDMEINEHVYVPLGIFKISRSFYSAVIGTLTTFSFIVIQFHLKD